MMETLQFDFGTTPEEVIREALTETFMDETPDEEPIMWRKAISSNDLLTVLDALAAYAADIPTRQMTEAESGFELEFAAYKLRIEILAALGIKEG